MEYSWYKLPPYGCENSHSLYEFMQQDIFVAEL